MAIDLSGVLTHLGPELILTAGGLLVIGYDIVVRGREGRQAALAVITLLAALAATFVLFAQEPVAVLSFDKVIGAETIRTGPFLSDAFTHFFRVVSLLTTLLVLLSGLAFMRPRTPFKGEFLAFLLFAALAMNLMAGANDLIMIVLAIEFLSIVSYMLTAWLRGDELSGEGGLKYFLYGAVASAVMLYGLVLLYGATGTTNMSVIAHVVSSPEAVFVSRVSNLVLPAIVLAMTGFGFKIAVVPFHQWSPDAYHGAPTPVTSFLSIGPKAAGFALVLRFLISAFELPAFSTTWIALLTLIAIVTMAFGNVVALAQANAKRMMAYSSIAQAGYMLIGLASVGVATLALRQAALGSVLVYILAYLFTNAGAFAVIIAVEHATGSSDVSAFAGLHKRAPLLAISLVVFFLSLVGIPPLAGFIGKFSVFQAALNAGQGTMALVGVLVGVVSVGYYFAIVKQMYFTPVPDDAAPIRPSPAIAFVVASSLVMVLVIGLYAEPFVELAHQAVLSIMPVG